MNRVLFLMLALLLFSFTLGCETKQSLAPTPSGSVTMPAGAKLVTLESGQRAWVQTDKNNINMVRILYICDYPVGFIGPLPSGHCMTDGSNCHGPEIGPTGYYAASGDPEISNEAGDPDIGNEAKPWRGDPTADDAGDPDIGNNAGDADAIMIR